MFTGKIKFFDEIKGTGIIKNSDGKEFFVHYKDFESRGYLSIEPGTAVRFDPAKYKKSGFKAINVIILENNDGHI